MTPIKISKWLQKNFKGLLYEYGLETWEFHTILNKSKKQKRFEMKNVPTWLQDRLRYRERVTLACISPSLLYENGTIEIFCHFIKNERELEAVLRHELMHAMFAGYIEFEEVLKDKFGNSKKLQSLLAYLDAIHEITVRHLEKVEYRRGENDEGKN